MTQVFYHGAKKCWTIKKALVYVYELCAIIASTGRGVYSCFHMKEGISVELACLVPFHELTLTKQTGIEQMLDFCHYFC